MKTTVDIASGLLARAKRVAQRDAVTLKELIVEGLRSEIERREKRARVAIEPHVVHGKGSPPDLAWDRIRDALYGQEGSGFNG